ncbi:unnamed protein product [Caenorhabditis nigoni]
MHLDTICIKVEDTAESKVLSPTNTEEEGYGSGDEMHSGNESQGSGKSGELKRPDLKGQFRCSICSKIFCHSSSLSRHRMQAHFKSYKCTVCRKDISSSESLRAHMFKQHHISRMYMCRCCNWAFPDKSLLHIHLQSGNNNNNLDVIPHSVINRSCHGISDSFQLIRSPLLNLKSPDATIPSLPIGTLPLQSPSVFQTPPETPSWLAALPKPIPTTVPMFIADSPKKEEKEVYTSQFPTCSFKSDHSAFHQLSSDRTLISSPIIDTSSPSSSSSSSRISPRHECFDCHVHKTRASVADAQCSIIHSQMTMMCQERLESIAQMEGLQQTVCKLKQQAAALREHNAMFQEKLLKCQTESVRFLQSAKLDNPVEVTNFLNALINCTIITNP